jgi:transposase
MLQLTPQSRIFLAVQPVDFRKGIDGLAALCRQTLGDNPLGGAVYVFRNRAGTTLKLLAYDGQGFWLCTKRLSHGRFHWWPTVEWQSRPGPVSPALAACALRGSQRRRIIPG